MHKILDVVLKTKAGNKKATIMVKLTPHGRVVTPSERPMSYDSDFNSPVDITEDGEYTIDGFTFIVKDALKVTGECYLKCLDSYVNLTFLQENLFTVTSGMFFREKKIYFLDTKDDTLKPAYITNRDIYEFI